MMILSISIIMTSSLYIIIMIITCHLSFIIIDFCYVSQSLLYCDHAILIMIVMIMMVMMMMITMMIIMSGIEDADDLIADLKEAMDSYVPIAIVN
jgi:hypothetical protein